MSDPIKLGHFIGAPARVQAYEGVSIAESCYAPGTVVKPHAHDAALLTLVLSGDSTEEHRGRSRNLVAQTLLFTPAFEMHGHLFRNSSRWLNMQFSDAASASVRSSARYLLVKNDGTSAGPTECVSNGAFESSFDAAVKRRAESRP